MLCLKNGKQASGISEISISRAVVDEAPVWDDIILTHASAGLAAAPSGTVSPRYGCGDGGKNSGVFGMANMSMEIEGGIEEVVRVIQQIGGVGQR